MHENKLILDWKVKYKKINENGWYSCSLIEIEQLKKDYIVDRSKTQDIPFLDIWFKRKIVTPEETVANDMIKMGRISKINKCIFSWLQQGKNNGINCSFLPKQSCFQYCEQTSLCLTFNSP